MKNSQRLHTERTVRLITALCVLFSTGTAQCEPTINRVQCKPKLISPIMDGLAMIDRAMLWTDLGYSVLGTQPMSYWVFKKNLSQVREL